MVLCCNNIDQSPFPDMCGRSNMFRIGYFWNCITYCNRALSCYLHCTKYTCHGCSSLFHFLAQTLSSMHQMELLQKRVNLYILCRCVFFLFIHCKTDFCLCPSLWISLNMLPRIGKYFLQGWAGEGLVKTIQNVKPACKVILQVQSQSAEGMGDGLGCSWLQRKACATG